MFAARTLAGLLCACLQVDVASAAPATDAAPVEARPPGATVGLMRLGGDPTEGEAIREPLRAEIDAAGLALRGFKIDIDAAAKLAKCRKGRVACLDRIARVLVKNAFGRPEPLDYIIFGDVAAPTSGELSKIFVHDVRTGAKLAELAIGANPHDLIVKIGLARAVVAAITAVLRPPPPISAEEQAALDALDRDGPEPIVDCALPMGPRVVDEPLAPAEPPPPRRRWRRWRR